MVATRLFTAEDLEAFTENEEKLYEVVDGVLMRNEGVGGRHGNMSFEIGYNLHAFTGPRRLGRVFGGDTRFILRRDPDLVLIPDIAFVRAARIPAEGVWERIIPIPPDFALEIASITDTAAAVRRKAALYLDHGVRLVWIVWPSQRSVSVLQLGQPEMMLHEGDELDGADVIPGFRLPVAEIFAN